MRGAIGEIKNEKQYADLLVSVLPHVIHTEKENDRCTAALEELLQKKKRTREENQMVELLTFLIEDFEEKHYRFQAKAKPVDIVRHLIEANDLRQADLVDVFGTPSVVSEVLNGKRDLAKSHIEKLSERFGVSPELFFEVKTHHASVGTADTEG